ncbi:hypothetical protein BDZ97DRAFT_1754974 [Flammula alnicola]|nr:hypothetical protein BDZ97DRAFT_1754974 [Flammula alnicola]
MSAVPWSLTLNAKKGSRNHKTEETFYSHFPTRIKNIALTADATVKGVRTTLKLQYALVEDGVISSVASFTICNLIPGKAENHSCNILLNQGSEYAFEVIGPKKENHPYAIRPLKRVIEDTPDLAEIEETMPKRRGRPPGSKNANKRIKLEPKEKDIPPRMVASGSNVQRGGSTASGGNYR